MKLTEWYSNNCSRAVLSNEINSLNHNGYIQTRSNTVNHIYSYRYKQSNYSIVYIL